MSLLGGMTPGGDSEHRAFGRLLRQVYSALHRVERAAIKGLANTPVVNRGLMILSDGTDLYLELLDILLKNLKGLGGSDGKAILFSDRYSDDLDNAVADGTPPFMVYHDGAWYFVTGTDMVEQTRRHTIINGSFENWESGAPEFWTAKP